MLLLLLSTSNFTTKRHRTDRNRDTQTTERGHKHTEQATGQARGHTHHSPPRIPTLKQRLNRPPSGPPSQGQPGRQRSPEPQRRPRAQAPAHHHARAAPHPTHAVHPAHPSTPQPVGCGATDAAPALVPQRHPSCASPVQRCNCAPPPRSAPPTAATHGSHAHWPPPQSANAHPPTPRRSAQRPEPERVCSRADGPGWESCLAG